jgi:hypothetical protein
MASKMTVIQTAVRISTLFILSVAFAVSGSGAPSLFPISVHGKFGYVDATGRIAIEPRFNDANNFSEHLAAVKIGNQWGFIAESGEFTIPAAFDYVCDFFHSVAAVESHGKWGVIDTTGRFTTPPQFDELDCQRNDQYLSAPPEPRGTRLAVLRYRPRRNASTPLQPSLRVQGGIDDF